MKGEKTLGVAFALLGIVLLMASGAFLLGNIREDKAAEKAASEAVAVLETAAKAEKTEPFSQTVPSASVEMEEPTDPTDPPSLSSEFLDGHEYVGYLRFPSLDRKLPVMKIAYLEDLQIAPCLEKGSPLTDDAVISAHNYPSHFGPIRSWTGGEEVIFTTLDGTDIHYTVTEVKTIDPNDVAQVMESGHDLVLYTCTTGGQKRVILACDRI